MMGPRHIEVRLDRIESAADLDSSYCRNGSFSHGVARPDERARLTGRQTELTEWLEQQHERQEAVGTLTTRVRSLLKDFEALDTRRAKALLQTILASAHFYRDGRIGLEFR